MHHSYSFTFSLLFAFLYLSNAKCPPGTILNNSPRDSCLATCAGLLKQIICTNSCDIQWEKPECVCTNGTYYEPYSRSCVRPEECISPDLYDYECDKVLRKFSSQF